MARYTNSFTFTFLYAVDAVSDVKYTTKKSSDHVSPDAWSVTEEVR
jgi:hypothetical protein